MPDKAIAITITIEMRINGIWLDYLLSDGNYGYG